MNKPDINEVRTYGNIQTQYRGHYWLAFVMGEPARHAAAGSTEAEAIGALVLNQGKELWPVVADAPLARLYELGRAATPGPWAWEEPGEGSKTLVSRNEAAIAAERVRQNFDEARAQVINDPNVFEHEADKAYIAAASPDVVMALIEQRTKERQHARVKALEDAWEVLSGLPPEARTMRNIQGNLERLKLEKA